jgi:hypothetical protein
MEMKTDLPVIPGESTLILQSLDLSVNRPFKDNVKKLYMQWTAEGGHELMATGKFRRPSTEIMCTG